MRREDSIEESDGGLGIWDVDRGAIIKKYNKNQKDMF